MIAPISPRNAVGLIGYYVYITNIKEREDQSCTDKITNTHKTLKKIDIKAKNRNLKINVEINILSNREIFFFRLKKKIFKKMKIKLIL